MKKTIRTVLIASLAVVVVGSAAVGTSVLRASEEADSDYAAEPVVEENNVTFVEVADESERPAEEPAAEPAAEHEEAEPAGESAEGEEAEDPAEEPAEGEETGDPAEEEKDAEETEKPEVVRSIDVVCNHKGAVKVGDKVTLSAVLNGYAGCEVAYQWQISKDGGATWENVSNETNASYTFTITENSFALTYRVHVDVVSEPVTENPAEIPAEAPAAEE